MKDIRPQLIHAFRTGFCTPQIARLAKKLQVPSTTLHYNIKRLEKEGAIKGYRAIFDHKKIDEGFCAFVLLNLSPDEYGDPERIAKDLALHKQIEGIDICTGDFEIMLKVRTKDLDEYYDFVKTVISRKGVIKIKTVDSLKQVKSEYFL